MPHVLLYILVGAAGYAAIDHWIAANRPGADVRTQLLAGFLSLTTAGLGLATLLTLSSHSSQTLLSGGMLVIGLGILAWGLLPWVLASHTRSGHPLLPSLLSTGWAVLFLANLLVRPSLLYSDWQPPNVALSLAHWSTWLPTISPWWWAVQAMTLLTLGYCGTQLYHRYRHQASAALAMLPALLLLTLATAWDLLLTTRLVQGPFLTVFALMISTPYLSLLMLRGTSTPASAEGNHVAGGALPTPPATATQAPATPTPDAAPQVYPLLLTQAVHPDAHPGYAESPYRRQDTHFLLQQVTLPQEWGQHFQFRPPVSTSEPQPRSPLTPGHATLQIHGHEHIQQELTDISAYTSMLLHHLTRDEQDPKALAVLCKRLKQRVRDAQQRIGPEPDDATGNE